MSLPSVLDRTRRNAPPDQQGRYRAPTFSSVLDNGGPPQQERPYKPPRQPNKLPDFSWLEVYSADPDIGLYFRARFGEGDDVKVLGGGGGWEASPRPQRKPLTVWRGAQDVFGYEIPLIFDGYVGHRSVEGSVTALEDMAGIKDGNTKPPLLILNANGALAHDVAHVPANRWVIPTTPQMAGAERRRDDGVRIRQAVTVQFWLYEADDSLARATQTVNTKTVSAKKGDTYSKIAARYLKTYGGAKLANRLAQLNGARDGSSKLHAGQEVKLPTPQQLASWKTSPRR